MTSPHGTATAREVLTVGQAAPDFTLRDQTGKPVSLSDYRGVKSVVVVFYPFAFSGICTGELREIRDVVGRAAAEHSADFLRTKGLLTPLQPKTGGPQ